MTTTTTSYTDDGYADLSDHDSFINGPPHNTFNRLRREDPLCWTDYAQGKGFWSMVRHADIMSMNKQWKVLSSAQGIRMEDQTQEEYMARRTFQETDPPEHTRTRILLAKAFSKPVVADFENQIKQLCDDILTPALAKGEFDAVKEIARELPMRMLGQILGVPEEDLSWLVTKGDSMIANTDSDYTDFLLDKADTEAFRLMPFRSPAGAELYEYADTLMKRKTETGDDTGVLGLLLQPNDQGDVISLDEFRNFFCLAVAAGNDTTRYTLSASIQALAQHPELLEELQSSDDSIWDTAPDEFIRWASPTMYFRRTAVEDFEMHGKQVRKGDKVLLWFVSGNRDETAFDDPNTINLRRTPNRHLAFGQGGPHVCLGMWLARLEVRLLLKELVSRIKTIKQTDDHAFLRGNFVGGIKRLPVAVTLN